MSEQNFKCNMKMADNGSGSEYDAQTIAVFDDNSNELKNKLRVSMSEQNFNCNMRMADDSSDVSVPMRDVQIITVSGNDYNELKNKPRINSVVLKGNLTSEDLGISASFPAEGLIGDILTKTSNEKDGVSWITPATSAEQDNTRPITAAAVYTEIGNINALLATI